MSDPSAGDMTRQDHQTLGTWVDDRLVPDVSTFYEMGLGYFTAIGHPMEVYAGGPFCDHVMYTSEKPEKIKGVNHPEDFRVKKLVTDTSKFHRAKLEFAELAKDQGREDVTDFWGEVFYPTLTLKERRVTPYVTRHLKLQAMKYRENINFEHKVEHTFDPDGSIGDRVTEAKSYIPDREWFDPKVRELRIEDIITIFPDAERDTLALMLGRMGVGRSKTIPVGFKEPIQHTYRMAGVIVGRDAGLGKSTFFNGLSTAMARVGLKTETFRGLAERFGLKRVLESTMAYKDDLVADSLKTLLKSETTKTIISGGALPTEKKFKETEEVIPNCVMIANTNTWDNNLAYDLDPGIIDRIKLLSTRRVREVKKAGKYIPAVDEVTDDLRPHYHIPWLAEKLDVSVDTIYLWLMRLCTDYFWEVITQKVRPGDNPLEELVRKLTTRHNLKFKDYTTKAFLRAIMVSQCINKGGEWEPLEINHRTLASGLSNLYRLMMDANTAPLIDKLKEFWGDEDYVLEHFYPGIKEIVPESLKYAYEEYRNHIDSSSAYRSDITTVVANMMKKVTLRDGFKLSPSLVHLNQDWAYLVEGGEHEEYQELALEVLEWFKQEYPGHYERYTKSTVPDTGWVTDEYTPKKAEVLKEKYIVQKFNKEAIAA